MKLTRVCRLTNKTATMEIPMSEEDFQRAQAKWLNGTLIQDAFPSLTADHREFIKTGITPETWKKLFGDEN